MPSFPHSIHKLVVHHVKIFWQLAVKFEIIMPLMRCKTNGVRIFFDKLIRSSVGTNYRPAKVAPGTSAIQLNRHMHNQKQKNSVKHVNLLCILWMSIGYAAKSNQKTPQKQSHLQGRSINAKRVFWISSWKMGNRGAL